MPGMMARLMSEDWNTMADKANASPNHVARMERWIAKAKQANPSLNDDQAYRAAVMLKSEHYKKMGRLSVEARRLAKQAQAQLDLAPSDEGAA